MESLRNNINQLIKKSLNMEQTLPVQDPRLIKKEEEVIDWNHPAMQSQPFPESKEENIEKEKNQKALAEKN